VLDGDEQVIREHTEGVCTRRSRWWKIGRSINGLFMARNAASTRVSSM
jgi:hypothetical protein